MTPTYRLRSSNSTRRTVPSDGAAPSSGKTWTKPSNGSAVAQRGSPTEPSILGGTGARVARTSPLPSLARPCAGPASAAAPTSRTDVALPTWHRRGEAFDTESRYHPHTLRVSACRTRPRGGQGSPKRGRAHSPPG